MDTTLKIKENIKFEFSESLTYSILLSDLRSGLGFGPEMEILPLRGSNIDLLLKVRKIWNSNLGPHFSPSNKNFALEGSVIYLTWKAECIKMCIFWVTNFKDSIRFYIQIYSIAKIPISRSKFKFPDRIEIGSNIRDQRLKKLRHLFDFPSQVNMVRSKFEISVFRAKSGLYLNFYTVFKISDSKILYFDSFLDNFYLNLTV